MTRFDVMSKAIAHSIQNSLLYLLAKSQGSVTTRNWVKGNFQRLFDITFVGSLSVTLLCAHDALQSLFSILVKPIYKTMHMRKISSLGCVLHIVHYYNYYYYSDGWRSYRRTLLSSLCLSIDSVLFYQEFD